MSEDRFIALEPGGARPGRVPLPPAFAVKATTGDTGGKFCLLEVTLALDVPRHVHDTDDECVYVLEGEVGVELDGREHTARQGAFLLLPSGVPHALHRVSAAPPRVLQISAPGGWDEFLADLFAAGPAVLTGGELDPVKLNPIAAGYGVHYDEPA